MPCYIRMKSTFLQGLLWLYLLGFGFMALSLEPGYLDFDNLPDTNFSCVGKVIGGYYADLETNCQMFHVCTIGQLDEPMDIRFLCLNGTVFDQETRVCERIDEVDCSKSEQFYSLNLELYGNTQPATLEESPETEQPLIIKSTTTTTTTTQAPKTSRAPFYTTATTPRATTPNPQVISTHHFPVVNSPDIRFNPEEINISLHPGAPPDIRTKPVTYHQHGYSDSNKNVVVTTHSDNSDSKKVSVTTHAPAFDDKVLPALQEQGFIERPQLQVQQVQVKNPQKVQYEGGNKNFNRPTPSDINFGFTYHQTESNEAYQTEEPQQYHFHADYRPTQDYSGHHHRHNPHTHQYKSSTYQDDYTTTTSKANNNFQQGLPTTTRNFYLQSLTPPAPNQQNHYNQHGTDKPQRLQLPLPLLPTLPPLTFSSPAPFALQRHIETKRYTKDHQAPPRIIISASASVSDASGRRLNYSLGTIGAAEILEEPPSTYDEYKEGDVGLDPFYHDVPKIKRSRSKREVGLDLTPTDVIRNEKEAETVLKFLVDWYEDNRKTINTDPTVDKMIDDTRTKRQVTNKIKHSDIIRNEQEAIDVLKFLLEWYRNNERSTTVPTIPTSTQIKEDITPITKRDTSKVEYSENKDEYPNFKNSDLFNKNSKFSIIGREQSVDEKHNKVNDEKASLSRPDEDYVNDNFEPIAYNEKYGNKSLKPSDEKSKNKPHSVDHLKKNIEPIYYRDRSTNALGKNSHEKDLIVEDSQQTADSNRIIGQIYHDIQELNDALLGAKTEDSKSHVFRGEEDSRSNNINRITGQINHDIKELNDALLSPEPKKPEPSKKLDIRPNIINRTKSPINHESKELNDALLAASFDDITSSESGDTKTNNINKDQANQISTDFKDIFLTPQFDTTTVNIVSTEKTWTLPNILRTRGGRRRGTPRPATTAPVRPKDKKIVVIEKITEKAHTAKDDFNYLRTLYKVLSTTPMYNISEEANPYVKLKKITNGHTGIDIPSGNGNTSGSDEDKSETRNVPIVTTEQTTTSTVHSKTTHRRRGRPINRPPPTPRKKSERTRKRLTTTIEPTKESTQASTTSYQTVTPKDNDKTTVTPSLPTIEPRVTNGLENEQGETTSTEYLSVPETTTITPIVTTNFDTLETQTAFFNELTQNYKKLFGMLTTTVPGETTPPPTTTVDPILILGPHLVTTEPFNVWRRGFITTQSSRDDKRFLTTPAPASETSQYSTLPPTTVFFDNALFRRRSGNIQSVRHTTLPPTTTEAIQTTEQEPSTVTEIRNRERSSATIPTTLSDLYKEVNIEAVNGKILLQTIKTEAASTEEISTETDKHSETTTAKFVEQETDTPTTTTENYETSTIENVATTRVPNKKFFKDEEDEDELPENVTEHVLEENRHFLSSFTQSFSFTEEMDKDTPTIHESEILTKEVHEGIPFPTPTVEETTTILPTTEAVTETTTYPTTIIYYRTTTEKESETTEPPTQLNTEKMREFIKEVEATTKSVVVDAEVPVSENTEKSTSSAMGETLKELVHEIEGMTKSKIGTTTLEFTNRKPQRVIERTTKTTAIPSTEEVTTLASTTPYDEQTTQKTEHSITTKHYVSLNRTKVPTTTEKETTEENHSTTWKYRRTTTTTESAVTTTEVSSTTQLSSPTSTQLVNTTTELPSTTEETPSTTTLRVGRGRGVRRRGTRPPIRKTPVVSHRNVGRHRFSTETFTKRPEGRRQTIEEEIIDEIVRNSPPTSTEPIRAGRRRIRKRKRIHSGDESSTDAPLQRSVSATRAAGVRQSLTTTPLSKTAHQKNYIFNCFGKSMDKFYPDPRDCRLFHYCTHGYSKNQLLDMKFVCDQNTYFDDEKLICTKLKPKRCL